MKNSEIEYTGLSTDYNRLYDLLKSGKKIVGFYNTYVNNKYNKEYSKIALFSYDSETKTFNLYGSMFEDCFSKEEIISEMQEMNIRYFDLKD